MIKKILLTSVAVLLAVAFIGCDSDSGGYSAPSVMAVEDLPASGATVYPNTGTEQKAITLFANAIAAISRQVEIDEDYEEDGETTTYSIDETKQFDNGGLITYKGFAKTTMHYSDGLGYSSSLEPNTTYRNALTTGTTVELDCTVDNCTVTYFDTSVYEHILLNIQGGESKERMKSSSNLTIVVGSSSSDYSYEFDVSNSSASSSAYSITDEDGFGGKFIVSFSEDFDINIDSENIFSGAAAMNDKIKSTMATLEVYNDDNEIVLATEIPVSKLMKGSDNF